MVIGSLTAHWNQQVKDLLMVYEPHARHRCCKSEVSFYLFIDLFLVYFGKQMMPTRGSVSE